MNPHLVIVGASVRAAAQSARQAGFEVTGIDQFADRDLQECATAIGCHDYPRALARLAGSAAKGPWMYTGGLENYPRLVDRIAAGRKLLGNAGDVLRRVRDPVLLQRVLTAAGVACPDVILDADHLPHDGSWLEKGRRSSGGVRVRRFLGQSILDSGGPVYYQRFVAGTPASATYVAAGGKAVLIGVTEQLVGADHVPSENFRYVGSFGPLGVSELLAGALDRLGNVLARDFGLVGLFGVDGVLVDDIFWPVEINPRYTASMELIERAIERTLVGWHVDAALEGELPDDVPTSWSAVWAKKILLARGEMVIEARTLQQFCSNVMLADIPVPGTHIRAHGPVATLLTCGADRAEVFDLLNDAHLRLTF